MCTPPEGVRTIGALVVQVRDAAQEITCRRPPVCSSGMAVHVNDDETSLLAVDSRQGVGPSGPPHLHRLLVARALRAPLDQGPLVRPAGERAQPSAGEGEG